MEMVQVFLLLLLFFRLRSFHLQTKRKCRLSQHISLFFAFGSRWKERTKTMGLSTLSLIFLESGRRKESSVFQPSKQKVGTKCWILEKSKFFDVESLLLGTVSYEKWLGSFEEIFVFLTCKGLLKAIWCLRPLFNVSFQSNKNHPPFLKDDT